MEKWFSQLILKIATMSSNYILLFVLNKRHKWKSDSYLRRLLWLMHIYSRHILSVGHSTKDIKVYTYIIFVNKGFIVFCLLINIPFFSLFLITAQKLLLSIYDFLFIYFFSKLLFPHIFLIISKIFATYVWCNTW